MRCLKYLGLCQRLELTVYEIHILRISVLHVILLFCSDLFLPHWQAEIRCALEDRSRRRDLADFLRELDPSRTSPDNCNLLALEINTARSQ